MSSDPRSIADWRYLATNDPEAAANAFIDRCKEIDRATRKRVFACTLSPEAITTAFSTARNSKAALAGMPFLLKDLYDLPGFPTTASSEFLAEVRPNPSQEAALSLSLRKQGALCAGKTNLNEFAYGLSGENRKIGNCPHPIFPKRLSGGSSSGSAWAVRRGIVPLATGTDTGGSIRAPAAWCGIYGLRLSPGPWSREGCFPLAPSFDTPGWFTATAQDMASSIEALISPKERKSKQPRGLNLLAAVNGLSHEFRTRATETLATLTFESTKESIDAYTLCTKTITQSYAVLQSIEAFQVHQQWLDPYRHRYDSVVWQRLDRGRRWTSEQIEAAQQEEQRIRTFFQSCFEHYDYLVLPATHTPAISTAENTDRFRNDLLRITAPASFARCPVLTIPIQLASGESQGLQILYKDERSDLPLRIMRQLQGN